jgi:hypothetical protein
MNRLKHARAIMSVFLFTDTNRAHDVSSHLVILFFLRKEKQNMWENNAKYIHIQLTH